MNHLQSHALPWAFRSVGALVFGLLLFGLLPSGSLMAQQGLGFEGSFGYQSLNGEYGDILKGGVDAEFSMVYTHNRLRYGIGMDWASYQMEEPFEKESWSNVAGHLALSFFPFAGGGGRVRPWIEIRTVGRRLRPEGDFLGGGHEPPDKEGENISPIRVFGMSGAACCGRRDWINAPILVKARWLLEHDQHRECRARRN